MTISPPPQDPCSSFQITSGEVENSYNIRIEPCATGGTTNVSTSQSPQELQAMVLTMYGKKVYETKSETGSFTIEGVPPGMYILKVWVDMQLLTERIAIK